MRIASRQAPIQRGRRGGIMAASAAQTDVAAAVAAAEPGDTVYVPAGDATWSSAVTISKPLSVIGLGATSGTTLTGSGALADGFFRVTNVTSSSLLRISGFRFVMRGTNQVCAINASGSVDLSAFRVDHNRFDEGQYHIKAFGCKGVIDHNVFHNSNIAIDFSAGSVAQANASWASMAAGTADALFIEDNTFLDDADYPLAYTNEKIGTENGGKLVVRYNEFDFDDIPIAVTSYPFMAHGSAAQGASPAYWQCAAGGSRGQSVIEFYENTMHGPRIDWLYCSRGSANLVWNNDIVGTVQYNPIVYFYEEEQYESQWSPNRTAWPAEDQVHNTFIWGNTYNGSPYFNTADHIGIGESSRDYIQLNREVFLHAPQATGGKASFTGANGATNTYPTDGNTYPTLGTMTFSASGANEYYGYAPYTYPHPLAV